MTLSISRFLAKTRKPNFGPNLGLKSPKWGPIYFLSPDTGQSQIKMYGGSTNFFQKEIFLKGGFIF